MAGLQILQLGPFEVAAKSLHVIEELTALAGGERGEQGAVAPVDEPQGAGGGKQRDQGRSAWQDQGQILPVVENEQHDQTDRSRADGQLVPATGQREQRKTDQGCKQAAVFEQGMEGQKQRRDQRQQQGQGDPDIAEQQRSVHLCLELAVMRLLEFGNGLVICRFDAQRGDSGMPVQHFQHRRFFVGQLGRVG